MRFDPLGIGLRPHASTCCSSPTSHEYTIEVLALTGLIHFHEGEFEREPPDDGDFR